MDQILLPHQLKVGLKGVQLKKEMASRHDALLLYQQTCNRLLSLNEWNLWNSCPVKFSLFQESTLVKKVDQVALGTTLCIETLNSDASERVICLGVDELFQEKNLLRDEELFGFSLIHNFDSKKADSSKKQKGEACVFYVMRSSTQVTLLVSDLSQGHSHLLSALWRQAFSSLQVFTTILGLSRAQWRSIFQGMLDGREI